MGDWRKDATKDLKRLGVDGDALFSHLTRANHIKRPADTWRKKLRALGPSEAIAALLGPFTPHGKLRPSRADAPAVFGAVWAAADLATPELLDVVTELVPWCQKAPGTSHQVASVGVMALGVWPASTVQVLERFRDDPALASLLATTRASLRKQGA
ncbi:MAG: hypothetical protein ABI467_13040 [Kofleriaceae bacterium]